MIVTGGASGLGQATCLLLAREGATVAVTDVNDRGGKKLAHVIKSGSKSAFWHLDVSKEREAQRVFADIYKQWGRIDVLVNNAGIAGASKPTHELTEAEWEKVMAVNAKGVFLCTKHVIPYMKKRGGGSIINLSSVDGIVGAPDYEAYHASKGAVRLMTKTDALTYAKDNIRVNSVHPGYIWTPMVREDLKSKGDVEEGRKHLDSLHPIGHIGEPDDVAYGVLYLASDESKFVTGSELVIDGGYTAQ